MDKCRIMSFFCGSCKNNGGGFRLTRITAYINSPEDAAKYFRRVWDTSLIDKQEEVYAIYVDANNKVISPRHLHTGGIKGTDIDTTVLFQYAYELKATGFFLAHNHPNGTLKPSKLDQDMTAKIANGSKLLNLTFWDHIIMTKNGYYSFKESGII